MPFERISCEIPDTNIGLWRIDESEEYFLSELTLYSNEQRRLASIPHPKKRLEWLASRLCLKRLIEPFDTIVESLNRSDGKPYLSTNSHHISYTHSFMLASAIASPRYEVAIDIEYRHRRRNKETAYLFLDADELNFFQSYPNNDLLFLVLWSAKETLYKAVGEKGTSLRYHIHFDLTNFTLHDNGILSGLVHKAELQQPYEVFYTIYPDFILTYTALRLQPIAPIAAGGSYIHPQQQPAAAVR